jgi:beta-galactosidase
VIRRLVLSIALVCALAGTAAATEAKVVHDDRGWKLQVDGRDFLVRGMNWGYSPIGENYSYSLWSQPDEFIEKALRQDMSLLKAMGVNAIRQFPDIPPRWVEWIYKNYGIYTMINHTMGRYGATINGVWTPNIDYANPEQRKAITDEIIGVVEKYKNTPGVFMWVLGNENNYGLAWTSFEAEALPQKGQEDTARAAALYQMYGEVIRAIKQHDTTKPTAIANGDLQYIDLIAKYVKPAGLDILGSNVYRGKSARDFYEVVAQKLAMPAMFTEFGSDAYNAKDEVEDVTDQAEFLRAQWQEIYEQSWGKGRVGDAIGGFIFQWTDGWWKYKQDENLEVHDNTASWPNAAYGFDYVEGQNNMNEEWFGIAAIESQDGESFYKVQPRAAYYLLKAAFKLDPYAETTTLEAIRAHFGDLDSEAFVAEYASRHAEASIISLGRVRVSGLRLKLEMNTTKRTHFSSRWKEPLFDHTESFFVDFVVQPTPRFYGKLSLSIIGNAAQNRLDPLYWENTTKAPVVVPGVAPVPVDPDVAALQAQDHLAIYGAELKADYDYATLDGYYRVGHNHWGYEGDFFGLYREAYYGPSIDIYHANAPFGFQLAGKKEFSDFKLAFGPEIFWGANPTVIGKWQHDFKTLKLTVMHQEDIAQQGEQKTSSAAYEPLTRRSTVSAEIPLGAATLEVGGVFAAPQRVDRPYTFVKENPAGGYLNSGYDVYTGHIAWADTLGARARFRYDGGFARWYLEGGYRGLVADAGGDYTTVWTGWTMKSSGRGNQVNALGGVLLTFGNLQIAPNLLWQKPIVGPNPVIPDQLDNTGNTYSPGVGPRNVINDPFAVLENRETVAGEMLLVWDPTPGTWYWAWDRERREDAPFAASLDTVYRHQPTSRDASLIILASGAQVPNAFAPPAHDVWQSTFAWSSALPGRLHLSGTAYVGQDQPRAGDLVHIERLVTRYGASFKLVRDGFAASTILKLKDWGPYDYHRDFNLTYPIQWYGDVSYGLPGTMQNQIGAPDARIGFRWEVRRLDGFSENYVIDPAKPHGIGTEAEGLVYILVGM